MKERAAALGPERSMLGIFTRPDADVAARRVERPGVLLMNAGLVHRVGPNRLNVNLARHLAAKGYTSLRVDLSGLGDSAPRRDRRSLEEAHLADLGEALDAFAEQEGLRRFVLAGVCSGADLSLAMAARDARVTGAVMIDSFAYATVLNDVVGYGQRLVDKESWRNLLSGQSEVGQRIARRLGFAKRPTTLDSAEDLEATVVPDWVMPPKEAILAEVERALDQDTELFFAYSGGPALYNYLTHLAASFLRLEGRGRLSTQVFREADHTFTSSLYQAELITAVDTWLARKFPT